MIDFQKEIKKYRPLLPLEEVEDKIITDDLKDLKELIENLEKIIAK